MENSQPVGKRHTYLIIEHGPCTISFYVPSSSLRVWPVVGAFKMLI